MLILDFSCKGSGLGVDDIMSYSNECGTLSFHRQSLKGRIQDYVIKFHKDEKDIDLMINDTYDLFFELIEQFKEKIVKARLVAKIHFHHFGKDEEVDDRFYHFGSYSSEVVNDPRQFFERHMMKISQRLSNFNVHGSNLVIKTISHIHIQLSCMDPPLL